MKHVLLVLFLCLSHRAEASATLKDYYVGSDHQCALLTDGTLWCWGRNDYGQLGVGDQVNYSKPVQVPFSDEVLTAAILGSTSDVSTSSYPKEVHTSCAILKRDQSLWCWGSNQYNQLGSDHGSFETSPVQLNKGTKFTQVEINKSGFIIAIDDQGKVWHTSSAHLKETSQYALVQISAGMTQAVKSIDALRVQSGPSFFYRNADDTVGFIEKGKIRNLKSNISGNILAIDAESFACGQNDTLAVYCWYPPTVLPSAVINGLPSQAITSLSVQFAQPGKWHPVYAVLDDGTLWSWTVYVTFNAAAIRKLYVDTTNAMQVMLKDGASLKSIKTGIESSCMLNTSNQLLCWGDNSYGQLGTGNNVNAKLEDAVAVSF